MKQLTAYLLQTLKEGQDASTGMPVLGVLDESSGVLIHEPSLSPCGRFEVNPETEYGITPEVAQEIQRINKMIDDAADAAIKAACFELQTKLGISSGDVAGQAFSENTLKIAIAGAMLSYMRTEARMADENVIAEADGKPTLILDSNFRSREDNDRIAAESRNTPSLHHRTRQTP
jgi:uncharacterized protein YunC (DUF1805 family)